MLNSLSKTQRIEIGLTSPNAGAIGGGHFSPDNIRPVGAAVTFFESSGTSSAAVTFCPTTNFSGAPFGTPLAGPFLNRTETQVPGNGFQTPLEHKAVGDPERVVPILQRTVADVPVGYGPNPSALYTRVPPSGSPNRPQDVPPISFPVNSHKPSDAGVQIPFEQVDAIIPKIFLAD